jgi:hypothetical protein
MLYRANRIATSGSERVSPRVVLRGIAQGGFQQSALKSLLRGETRSLRRGGNRPRPGFPLGETDSPPFVKFC